MPQIVDCVCREINKNVKKRKCHLETHLTYELSKVKIREKILKNIEPYDESQEFVTEMKQVLTASFKPVFFNFGSTASSSKAGHVNQQIENTSHPQHKRSNVVENVYCTRTMKILQELNEKYEEYLSNPGEHPDYVKEEKKFYDHNKSDVFGNCYQLHWKNYFKAKLTELKRQELHEKLVQLNLELPEENKDEQNRGATEELNFNCMDLTLHDDEEMRPLALQDPSESAETLTGSNLRPPIESNVVIVAQADTVMEYIDTSDEPGPSKRQRILLPVNSSLANKSNTQSVQEKKKKVHRKRSQKTRNAIRKMLANASPAKYQRTFEYSVNQSDDQNSQERSSTLEGGFSVQQDDQTCEETNTIEDDCLLIEPKIDLVVVSDED